MPTALSGASARLARLPAVQETGMLIHLPPDSAAQNIQTGEGVAVKKVTNVFSKKILAKRALREIKLLQHFRGHRNVRLSPALVAPR